MKMWLVNISIDPNGDPYPVAICSSPGEVEQALMRIVRLRHGAYRKVTRWVGQHEPMFVHTPIPDGELWMRENRKECWTSTMHVGAAEYEVDAYLKEEDMPW